MIRLGMLVGKYELNPYRRAIWMWLKLYLTPKRNHLKWNRLDYQLDNQFGKGACASRPDSREWRELSLKTLVNMCNIYHSSIVYLKRNSVVQKALVSRHQKWLNTSIFFNVVNGNARWTWKFLPSCDGTTKIQTSDVQILSMLLYNITHKSIMKKRI